MKSAPIATYGGSIYRRMAGVVRAFDPPLRPAIARRVSEGLQWHDLQRRSKIMSRRKAWSRLRRAGLIARPAPRNGNGNGRGLIRQPPAWPQTQAQTSALADLSGLHLNSVRGKPSPRFNNRLIDR